MKKVYVTTPIYYASGNVHIGNSYSTIVADVFARFHRLKGDDTYYLTGMDEHGQKIETKASELGLTPQQLVDKIALETKEVWENLKITNDDFIRTSEDRHKKVVQEVFEDLLKSGDIYLSTYEGNYCMACESYFPKSQLKDGDCCPDCGRKTKIIQEQSYFLKLKKYQDQLLKFIENNPTFIEPETRKNEVVSFIKQGLEDLCVSRTSFEWGIKVPSDPKHVVYVWIDALTNYISALGYKSNDDSLFQKYWVNGDKVVHVVGKDILRFHAIYWPIMLMALNVPINYKLYVHGWFLRKDGKMSKSFNNVIYPMDVVENYGLDSLRYFLVREMSLGSDAIFEYNRFFERFNFDLANDLGNLVSRSISMINKYLAGNVTKPTKSYFTFDDELEEVLKNTVIKYDYYFENFQFQNGLKEVCNLVRRANKYIDETLPWALAKDPEKLADLNSVMYHLYEVIRVVAIMVTPVMPDAAKVILDELFIEKANYKDLEYGIYETGKVVSNPVILFRRLDIEVEMKKHDNE